MNKLTRNGTKRRKCYCFVLFVSFFFLFQLSTSHVVAAVSLNDFLGYDLVDEVADDHEHSHEHDDHEQVTSDIAIKLKREYSDDLVSDLFAASYDLVKVARVSELDHEDSLFHFRINDMPMQENDEISSSSSKSHRHRTKRHVDNKIDLLRQDDRVELVFPQQYLTREKRNPIEFDDDVDLNDYLIDSPRSKEKIPMTREELKMLENIYESLLKTIENDKRRASNDAQKLNSKNSNPVDIKLNLPPEINFNDHNYKQQWYLINQGQLKIPPLHDLNVKNAWLSGYTGRNISIVIVDDGLDHEHPDFQGKYRPDLSYDFNDENDTQHDPMPGTFDSQNSHGTRCAGAAAANANNSVCGVGIAYEADIAGIRILDGPITDLLEGRALSYKAEGVDIRSASWGPKDDGSHMEYPGHFVNQALESGVRNGRNGKGTLFVWAAGNGGANDDDCSCDGYVSNWNIISIGSINHHGVKPYFMELCPSTMAVVYSGGLSKKNSDEDDPGVRVVASDVRGTCTTTFQGTSAAAPLAAGALALVLEANGDLTYRDVMHLIAKTSRVPNIEDKTGWIINGARFHVNEKYGFGVLDVAQMLQEAQTWKNVPPREMCTSKFAKSLPGFKENKTVILELDVENCTLIDTLEHVVANISFKTTTRGDLKLTLISPAGTPSEILSFRKNDLSNKAIKYFPFMTVFNWGESPLGEWKLIIETRPRRDKSKENVGHLEHFSMNFFGFKNPQRLNKRFSEKSRAFIPSNEIIEKIYKTELGLSRETTIINKRVLESNPEFRHILKSIE